MYNKFCVIFATVFVVSLMLTGQVMSFLIFLLLLGIGYGIFKDFISNLTASQPKTVQSTSGIYIQPGAPAYKNQNKAKKPVPAQLRKKLESRRIP